MYSVPINNGRNYQAQLINWLAGFQPSTVAPENGWLEDDPFLLGFRPIFRCKVLVSGRVITPIYKPFGRGPTTLLTGLNEPWSMVINHVSVRPGMIRLDI